MTYSSRRQFLKNASWTTVGVLAAPALSPRALASRPADATAPAPARQLDSGWEFYKGTLGNPWEVWRKDELGPWEKVTLPHCFNAHDACDPDVSYFRGQGWYRNRIAIDNPLPEGRTVLHFRGAGQTTTLWVGAEKLGTHKGGYDEFVFDITAAVAKIPAAERAKGVQVTVLCDNSSDMERVPSDLGDFCLYGGLYRHVSLAYLPAVALDGVHILPTLGADGVARVTVSGRLYNPAARNESCAVAVEIIDPTGKTVHTSKASMPAWTGFASLAASTIPSAALWSPETPQLYRCRVTLSSPAGESVIEERFGVRTIEFVEHGPFKLNGKRVLLRGTQRHADHAGFAAGMPDDLVRQEFQLIRDMGANFVRLGHYQQDRLVLELCDELGLMVWEEVPWCRSGVGDAAFEQNAKDMLTHMIEQHYNHPSVILWGLGNEDDWPDEYPSINQDAIRTFMTELRDLSHQLDGSRLTSFRRCDFARDIPDVYSPSIWAGWYRGNYHEYEQTLLTERDRVKRLIHIEWGADSQAGRHSEDPEAILHKIPTGKGTDERGLDYMKTGGWPRMSRDGDWSETYACNLFDWHLKTQEKLDWLTGSAQWIFKDFPSPLRGDSDIPRINQKGVLERDMTKKESYFVFQSYWTQKPMLHIYGHTWPVRWGKPGEQREVKIYSNCEQVELFLNDKSLGTKHRDSQDFPAAGLRWNVAFAAGKNSLRAVGTKGSSKVTDQIELTYQTDPWDKPATLRLAETGRSGDTVTITATIHDAKDVLCVDSRNLVRFSLAGNGKLIDNLGTSRGSRELHLYNGRATISLQRKGACAVAISSEGLAPAFLNIT